ncbi:hypothetical protein [Blautia sp. HCP3S3_C4]|uniref:hypothetical protein n=1 Tax=Blautia sp. HCP3S3_C4 TaxID=3438911 RepID=UPI003F8CBF35
MKTAGIDIGTTTISGVVLENEENGQAKILPRSSNEQSAKAGLMINRRRVMFL